MMAVQPPATTAGPTPNGMISAPLPDNAQPLTETFERLSTIVRIHKRTPANTPRRAISPVNPGSRLGSPIDPAIEQHPTESPPPAPSPASAGGRNGDVLSGFVGCS